MIDVRRVIAPLAAALILMALAWLVWPTVRARAKDCDFRPPKTQIASMGRSEDARIERALTRFYPAFDAIRRKTPENAVVSVFVPLDDEHRLAINGMTQLLYPRHVDWYLPLRDHYLAHPEELTDRVYTISLTTDETIPMANWFDELERGPGYILYHYRGTPK